MNKTLYDYIIADTHFKHENILKHEPLRAIKAKEHNKSIDKVIIDMWNSTVTESDTILHLGDVSDILRFLHKERQGLLVLSETI